MQPIDVDALSENSHFEDVAWVIERMGLHKLVKVKCDYNIHLIQQFYATLVFKKDEDRTMKWMTDSTPCTTTFHMFSHYLTILSVAATVSIIHTAQIRKHSLISIQSLVWLAQLRVFFLFMISFFDSSVEHCSKWMKQ
jgi:hypothetical protein